MEEGLTNTTQLTQQHFYLNTVIAPNSPVTAVFPPPTTNMSCVSQRPVTDKNPSAKTATCKADELELVQWLVA